MFRVTIRDLLLFTATVALVLTLALTIRRRAQRFHHDLVTCGPNNLKPSYLSN